MTAEQARDFGIIDKVLESRDEADVGALELKAPAE
jgi:ATP-dependent Clp protease protease subunit